MNRQKRKIEKHREKKRDKKRNRDKNKMKERHDQERTITGDTNRMDKRHK